LTPSPAKLLPDFCGLTSQNGFLWAHWRQHPIYRSLLEPFHAIPTSEGFQLQRPTRKGIGSQETQQAYQAYSTTRAREPVLKGCFVRQAGATQTLFSICSGHCALNWIKLFFANLFAIDPAMAMNDKSSV